MPDRNWGGEVRPTVFEDHSLPGSSSSLAWGLSVLEDEKVGGNVGGNPKGVWVQRAMWEESLGSQSVSNPVSETGPLSDK